MHIDSAKLQEAKAILGDRNAELIAQILELPDYDEKNKKACCPYHDEDTPSFIYNPKKMNFKCFGCGVTVDIIDVLMQKGNTYLQACQRLFAEAGMDVPFGEAGVKTKAQYRYPHSESDDIAPVHEYFNRRGISDDTLEYLGIGSDEHGNAVFNYYDDNDVLTMVKYRPARTVHKGEPKMWCQRDSDTAPLLFNMNRVNISQPLLITEGECMTGDVEVLTKKGWLRLDQYSNEEVMQVNKDLTGSFVKPYARVHKKYKGDMYTYKRRGNFELTTTAKHNWVYIDYKGRLTKRRICDFPHTIGSGKIPTTVLHNGNGIKLSNNWIAFILAISADASIDKRKNTTYNYARVGFKKQRKIDRFECLCNKLNLEYAKTIPPSNKEYVFFGVKIPIWIEKELPIEWIYQSTLEQKKFILQELVNWDGNKVVNRNQIEYSSVLKHNADFVQTIAHTCGYMSTIMQRQNKYGKWFKVSVLYGKNSVSYQKGITSIDHYEGDVYCVSVPSGMILVRQNNKIAITGNCDTASAIESGWFNAVSIPLGAQNTHWIEECWEWLEQFNEIIVAFDNDEAGQKARKDVIYRLGTWRTKYIDYPKTIERDGKTYRVKDMNDCLQAGGESFVLNMITNAKDIPVSSVVDFTDVDDLDVSDMTGITTGIKPLDKKLIKIFDGTLTILSGRPGSGKTSLIDQSIATAIDDGNSVFLFSKEMPERMSTNWFNYILAGRRNLVEKTTPDGETYSVVSLEAKKAIKEFYKSKLYIYKDSEPNDIESVMKSMEECVRKYGVKYLVIDNLMMLDLQCSEEDKNTAQTNLINELIRFASKFNVAVVLIAHPRKTADMQSDIEMYDIAGSSNIINLAMRSIGLRRVSKKEKEDENCKWRNYNVVLTIMKDRLLGKADMQMGLYYDVQSRRFFTDYEEFDAQYRWDKKNYTTKLEMPIEIEESPFE